MARYTNVLDRILHQLCQGDSSSVIFWFQGSWKEMSQWWKIKNQWWVFCTVYIHKVGNSDQLLVYV